MTAWGRVDREHVLQAVAEYDRLGQQQFLDRYGFGSATAYLLRIGGRTYDSKAVLGVAYRFATGERLTAHDFNGGKFGAAGVLRKLGFEVTGPDLPAGESRPTDTTGASHATSAGTYLAADGSPFPFAQARPLWAAQARELLTETARSYHATVTYKHLAEYVQEQTGIRTQMLLANWIGGVLGLVSQECARRGEPLLSALCVNQEGSVGEGYAIAVHDARGQTPADADDHAAIERLACYRAFGASLPADGGRPALTPAMLGRRERAATRLRSERPPAICPRCFMQLPVRGICTNCDT